MVFSRQCLQQPVIVALILSLSYIQGGSTAPANSDSGHEESGSGKTSNQLVIIMLDGFRWNYYHQHKSSLPNFQTFLADGVQAEWVEPIFPSVSYPSWTTINTGVFPDVHDVSGNQMLDVDALDTNPSEAEFRLGDNSTKLLKWWQSAEPIWITATKHKKRSYLRFWDRCDVPFHGVSPEECTGYEDIPYLDTVQEVRDSCEIAILKLLQGFQLIMVYGDVTDAVGHKNGPHSPEMKIALIGIDEALGVLLSGLKQFKLENKVNIIIVSDHGMAFIGEGSGFKRISLDDYMDGNEIIRSVDDGAVVSIATKSNHRDEVYNKLKDVHGMDVYKREDIPEEYHIKDARYTLDLLLVARDNYYIHGLEESLTQMPWVNSTDTKNGTHGFAHLDDMRTIFFAKGPAFKKGIIASPIRMEDEYQIFAKLLKIPAQPNNGSWSRVEDMFLDADEYDSY